MRQEIAIVAVAAFLWGTVFAGAARHIAVSGPIEKWLKVGDGP